MKAIWRGLPYAVVDDDGEGVFMELMSRQRVPTRHHARYADETLTLDPTDLQWAEAVAHLAQQDTPARQG